MHRVLSRTFHLRFIALEQSPIRAIRPKHRQRHELYVYRRFVIGNLPEMKWLESVEDATDWLRAL